MLSQMMISIFFIMNVGFCFAQISHIKESNGAVDFQPNIQPTLEILRVAGKITIDGELNDPGWNGAATASNFSETYPDEKAKPSVHTEVLVTYDDAHLYLAFKVEDDPSKIRTSMRDRDEMWSDDYVGILLDTYGDASWAYFLFANPLGIQGDSRFSSTGGEDDSFNIVYYSKGQITSSGYQVEMAIPFRSLRFPDRDEQNWRATFWITHPRDSRRTYSWAAIDRDEPCFLCQYGTLKGLKGIKSGKNIEFLPSVVSSQFGSLNDSENPTAGFNNEGLEGDLALGLKYNFTSNLTADLAFNPDFSQVEADVAQIDVNSTFALFFPERRPFYQEGSDLFRTFIRAVYTRSMNNPIVAAKLTGRFNRTSVAYMGAVDESTPIILPFEEQSAILSTDTRSTTNIFRFKQTFLEDSYVGALLTDRRLSGGGSGTVVGIDGTVRFLKNYRFEWQYVASHTEEPSDSTLSLEIEEQLGEQFQFNKDRHTGAFDGESFWGNALYASVERDARTWNFDVDYWQWSPTFRADNGFVTGNDRRQALVWTGLNFWPKSKFLDRISPNVNYGRIWNYNGVRKDEWVQSSINANLKAQTFLWISYVFSTERFADMDFSGIRRLMMNVNSNFSDPIRVGFFFARGRSIYRDFDDPQLGISTNFDIWATIKPTQRWIIQPSFNFSKLRPMGGGENFFSGYIFRTRLNYQFNRQLFFRLVVQYNDFSKKLEFDPLLTYRINAFTAFFIGSTLDYRSNFDQVSGYKLSSRQFFMKFQYLYQL